MSKVSVIAISYNHAPFIKEALESVFAQTYEDIELIILDDGSTDDSRELIKDTLGEREASLLLSEENLGYTKTFNKGLGLVTGDYIIDFALDDIMKPSFVEESVKALEARGEEFGVSFANAEYIDRESKVTAIHTEWLKKQGIIDWIPEGDIFQMVLKRYFICTPTMMIKRSVFDRIGGYDQELAYEDFDFWVRTSRYWQYCYIDKVLVQKRKLETSMSAQRYRHKTNGQMRSVYKVCEKAASLCDSRADYKALRVRLNYEFRQCLRHRAWDLAHEYQSLLKSNRLSFDLATQWVGWFGWRLRLRLK